MPLIPGEIIDTTDLDAAFAAVGGTVAVAPGAVQVAHTDGSAAPRLLHWAHGAVGTGLPGHTAPLSCPSSIATPPTRTAMAGSVVAGAGWTLTTAQFMRVRWSAQVRPRYTGTPWISGLNEVEIDKAGGAGFVQSSINGNCWLIELQYASNAALTTWVSMPGQTTFASAIRAKTGGLLSACTAVAIIPAWHVYSIDADKGSIGTSTGVELHWTTAEGEFLYQPPTVSLGPIYGFRLVVHGIYSMYQDASNNNALVVDTAVGGANQYMETDCGTITAEVFVA